MNNIINDTQDFLYNYLYKNEDVEEHEIKYRYEHSLRVANIGLELAKLEKVNELIVVLGCLLHDVGKFDTEKNRDHGRASAVVAREFLKTQALSKEEVDDICYAVAVHVDGECDYEYPHKLEAKIVTDSDNIDRYSSSKIRESRLWDLNQKEKSKEKQLEYLQDTLAKLNGYLNNNVLETKAGNEKFKDKVKLQLHFFTEYLNDHKLTKTPRI